MKNGKYAPYWLNRKNRAFFSFILFSLAIYPLSAQVDFAPGYIVSYAGDTLPCWILDKGWRKNPTEVKIRRAEKGPVEVVSYRQIKAFGIGRSVVYEAECVAIDISPNTLDALSIERDPIWRHDTLFLKQLIGGDLAKLYVYEGRGASRYFMKVGADPIEQLIYKQYRAFNGQVMENREFAFQLMNNLRCGDTMLLDPEKISCVEKDLIPVFLAFNACSGGEGSPIWASETQKIRYRFRVLSGMDFQYYRLLNYGLSSIAPRTNRIEPTFRFGLEGEVFLPFNKNKWSVIGEAGFHYFRNQRGIPIPGSQFSPEIFIRYHAIETLLGVRHYLYLPGNRQVTFSASAVLDWNFNSNITIGSLSQNTYLNGTYTGALGAGYQKGRLGIELRAYAYRVIMHYLPTYWDQRLAKASLVFSFRL